MQRNSNRPAEDPKQPNAPPVGRPVSGISDVKAKLDKRKAERDKELPEQKYSRRTANATWWIAAFTIVLGVVSVFTLIEVILGGSDTHDLAQAALAANRAWLAPVMIQLTNSLEHGPPLRYQARIADTGREPAFGVVYRIKPRLVPYIPQTNGFDESAIGANNTCLDLQPSTTDGLVFYPDAPSVRNWIAQVIDDTPENCQMLKAVMERSGSLLIEGCFMYRTGGGIHKTMFRFFLRDAPDRPSFVLDQPGKPGSAWQFNPTLKGNDAD